MGLTWGCQENSGQDKATAVRFDAGVGLFYFLALRVTLMNKFGSLSQEYDRIGREKVLRINAQRCGERYRLLVQEECELIK